MLAGDVVRYALGTMRRRKLRTALTSLGVTMAIAVVVALLSITQGLQTSVERELSGLGADTLTVSAREGSYLLVNDTAVIEGVEHNGELQQEVLEAEEFVKGNYNTDFLLKSGLIPG